MRGGLHKAKKLRADENFMFPQTIHPSILLMHLKPVKFISDHEKFTRQ